MADIAVFHTTRTGNIVAGASVNVYDSLNVLVASGTTASDGTWTVDLLTTASFTAHAEFIDGSGTWTGSASFSTDPNQITSVTINLTLH